MITDGGLEDGEGTGCEFVLLNAGDFVFAERKIRRGIQGILSAMLCRVRELAAWFLEEFPMHRSALRKRCDKGAYEIFVFSVDMIKVECNHFDLNDVVWLGWANRVCKATLLQSSSLG